MISDIPPRTEPDAQQRAEARHDMVVRRLVMFAVVVTIAAIDTVIPPDRFADFYSYIDYLGDIVTFPDLASLLLEPFSKLELLFLYRLTGSVDLAVVIAHYLLGAVYILLLSFLVRAQLTQGRRVGWQAVLIIFCLVGPLLAFVTIRATPAYLLASTAVLRTGRSRSNIGLFVLGSLVHLSALFAAAALGGAYLYTRFFGTKSRRWPLLILAFVGAVALVKFGQTVSDLATTATSSIPILARYAAYTYESSSQLEIGANHYIYMTFMVLCVAGYSLYNSEATIRLTPYIISSFVIYVALFFFLSPVAAFRQTPFWLIPMMITFPWENISLKGASAPFILIFSVGIFIFQMQSVYV